MKQRLFLDKSLKEVEKEILIAKKEYENIKVYHYLIDDNNKNKMKCQNGNYFVLNYSKDILFTNQNIIKKELKKIMSSFFKKYKKDKVLIIGLGNSEVMCDSLGVLSANKIIATNHYDDFLTIPKLSIFKPEITEKTGINTFKLISLVVNDLKPNTIIIIDSLATKNRNYLNTSIEVNDVGIIPGSAIKNNKIIDKETFNIPIISVGVPLVLEDKKSLFTTTDIKFLVDTLSDMIANTLNELLLH